MNPCRDLEPLLVHFADGDLSDSDRVRVANHLDTCAQCKQAVVEYQRSLARITQVFAHPAPTAHSPRRPVWRVRRLAVALTGVAFIAVATLQYAPHRADPRVIDPLSDVSRAEVEALLQRIAKLEADVAAFEATQNERIHVHAQQNAANAESIAAITLAAGVFLEERQGNLAEATLRYQYAAENFSGTKAGQEARDRLDRAHVNPTGDSST